MNTFLEYWNSYATEKETNDFNKIQWSHDSINAGIVEKAFDCLASLIYTTKEIYKEKTCDGLITCSGYANINGLRCKLFAITDIKDDLESYVIKSVFDSSREAFSICIVPTLRNALWPLSDDQSHIGGINVISLYPCDVDALLSQRITIYDLIVYKLYRRFILDKPAPATQYDARLVDEMRRACSNDGLLDDMEKIKERNAEEANSWVEHPQYKIICNTLDTGRGCLIVGPSSSGKSVLSFQVGNSFLLRGEKVKYCNLGQGQINLYELFSLFFPSNDDNSLIILDDLQSNPSWAKLLLASISAAQRCSLYKPPSVLAITWIDFASEAIIWLENCVPIAVGPHQLRAKLIAAHHKCESDSQKRIVQWFGEDIFLLRQALEQSLHLEQFDQPSSIAESIWKSRTDKCGVNEYEIVRICLVVGSLGRFDISTPIGFLCHEAKTTPDAVEKLIASKFLRRHVNNLSLGHRSLCSLLSDWLDYQNGWQKFSKNGKALKTSDVVLDYLRSLGSGLAVDVLRSIQARVGFKDRPKLNVRAAVLVEIWGAFNSVLERIEHQQSIDATWGTVPSSAMFAIKSFCEVGKQSLCIDSIKFLRKHWNFNNDVLTIDTTGLSTNDDFEQILNAMTEEDAMLERDSSSSTKLASQIDVDRFHRTWLWGLILGAEAVVDHPKLDIKILAELVEREQLQNGAFYPERVPWCTARILLGLAACGRSIYNSPVVNNAVKWLLKSHEEGGACNGGLWKSGTGRWNSTLETTGMVLMSLASVGYDCSDKCLASAQSYLLSQKNNWTVPGNELDGALSIQAFLDTGGEWEEVANETYALSRWAKNESLWQGATKSSKESLDQSCKVAQIASHLISIGWMAVQSDLPAFLDALATTNLFRNRFQNNTTEYNVAHTEESISISSENTAYSIIFDLKNISLTECTVVGSYRRHDERIRNQLKDWSQRIKSPILNPTTGRENFLIWASPGSGKSFFIQEIARSLGDICNYYEINLARYAKEEFCNQLDIVKQCKLPVLCLLDEIDTRVDEVWPYEECFSLLDLNITKDRDIVFVLIGSSSAGLLGMLQGMRKRPKGQDLVDRIPESNRFEIPGLTLHDSIIIAASQILTAANNRQQPLQEIEKLALYYLLKNKELISPRQLSEFVVTAVQRMTTKDDRMRYDDLFHRGDRRNQSFWMEHHVIATNLSGTFIRVEA